MQAWLSHLKKLRIDSKYRKECKSVFITGTKAIRAYPWKPIKTGCTQNYHRKHNPHVDHILNPSLFSQAVGESTPEGIVWEVPIPTLPFPSSMKRLLVLDRVQDPGNTGTLIRTADAFGWDGVVCVGGADPFNINTLRAAKGSCFRIPAKCVSFDQMKALAQGLDFVLACPNPNYSSKFAKSENVALVLGSEGQGISDCYMGLNANSISIKTKTESLNVAVAGGILMHEIGKSVA